MLIAYSFMAFLLSCSLCPLIIKFCNKKNLFDEINERKIHTGNIPRFGGIAVFVSFIITVILFDLFSSQFDISEYWQVILSFFIIFITGVLDDYLNLNAKLKLALQICAALIVATSPFYFKDLNIAFPFEIGRFAIFFWILLCINAYNLIDGMDWLCSGLSIISVLTFAICGLLKNTSYYSILFLLSASIAGFMVWNKPDAKIFLGDGGSTTLGFIIAVIPVLNPFDYLFNCSQILICLLISSIPVIDIFSAIIRRLKAKKSIFAPDKEHLHHKLLNLGFSKKKIIFYIFSIQIYIGLLIVVSQYTTRNISTILALSFFVVLSFIFLLIHYVNLYINRIKQN